LVVVPEFRAPLRRSHGLVVLVLLEDHHHSDHIKQQQEEVYLHLELLLVLT
jgi:hypothetical protein